MKLQGLDADARCLPRATAMMVVAQSRQRLSKQEIETFTTRAAASRRATTDSDIFKSEMRVDALLGRGSFSTVYAIDDRFAVKVLQPVLLDTPHIFANCAADLVLEGMILQALQHPHIVKCHYMGDIQAFANGRHDSCVLLLDRLHCTLTDKLEEWCIDSKQFCVSSTDKNGAGLFSTLFGCKPQGQQANHERTRILCELADALQYLHANRVMHRDLKPDNLGLTDEGRLKVFDLDVCRILPEEAVRYPDKTYRFTSNTGSRRYMAPEVARGDEYNAKSDVYSFGLLCYAVLSLDSPYEGIPDKVVLDRVVKEGLRPSLPK